MARILRIVFTVLSAIAIALLPFIGIFFDFVFVLVDIGVALAFFFAMLVAKSMDKTDDGTV